MTQARAYILAGLNLLVLPGLGTLLTGRRIAGLLQIALGVAGFLLSVRWFSQLMTIAMTTDGFPDLESIPFRSIIAGSIIILASWLWSLVSSLQILRAARKVAP